MIYKKPISENWAVWAPIWASFWALLAQNLAIVYFYELDQGARSCKTMSSFFC